MLYSYSGFRWRESCSVRHVAHSGQGVCRPARLPSSRLARPDVPCGPASSQTPPATLLATFSAGLLWVRPCRPQELHSLAPKLPMLPAASVANGVAAMEATSIGPLSKHAGRARLAPRRASLYPGFGLEHSTGTFCVASGRWASRQPEQDGDPQQQIRPQGNLARSAPRLYPPDRSASARIAAASSPILITLRSSRFLGTVRSWPGPISALAALAAATALVSLALS